MCSVKKGGLKQFQKINRKTPVPEFLFKFIKKEALTQVFCRQFCKIFKNIFFIEHLWWLL